MRDDDEDTRTYDVVINDEEQYSIWLTDRPIPNGWRAVGQSGLKAECLEYIDRVWTDMRPLSLRRHMEAFANERAAVAQSDTGDPVADTVDTAVEHSDIAITAK